MTPSAALDLATLTHAQFAPCRGEAFVVRRDGEPAVPLTLVDVKPLGAHRAPVGAKREPFSLLFRAATRELQLPQQIHPLEHPQLGRLELFMVPLGPDATGMRYEAILA